MKYFIKSTHILSILTLLFVSNPAYSKNQTKKSSHNYNIRELTLPSELKELGKSSGSIYYSSPIKGKVLIPVHIWGAIGKSGLHFLPVDTTLVQGISFAGGLSTGAISDDIRITKKIKNKIFNYSFDLSDGGKKEAHAYQLAPGDIVFVEKSHFYENRAYYTGLIGVAITILSTVILYSK